VNESDAAGGDMSPVSGEATPNTPTWLLVVPTTVHGTTPSSTAKGSSPSKAFAHTHVCGDSRTSPRVVSGS
jgi:hypothetical protein